MPWLTDLADACRKSGLQVTEVDGWRTRGHGPMTAARGIVCHHTVGPASGNYPSLRVVRDGRPGLDGPLAQLGLARDGSVLVIAAGLSYHAGRGSWPELSGNSDCIGIEAESVGNGKDWTPAQLDAYPRLCRALAQHYGIPASRVIAHREWAPGRKIDPAGIDMNALRQAVDQATSTKPVTSAAPVRHTPRPASTSTGRLNVKLVDLRNAHRTLVRGPGVKPLQRLLGVKADGLGGPDTKAALGRAQARAGVAKDYMFGPASAEAFLAGRGV